MATIIPTSDWSLLQACFYWIGLICTMACVSVTSSLTKFRHPFTAICAGATSSGKTTFLCHLIQQRTHLITPVPERVIYSYKAYQPIFEKFDDQVELVQGQNYELDAERPTLLIIDDQFTDRNQQLIDLFCVHSHHKNTSVILVSQSLYFDDKSYRTACRNAMYTILFKSPRDRLSIRHMAQEMFDPSQARSMIDAYQDATSQPYGYLVVDMKPDTPACLRLRSNVLDQEGKMFKGTHLTHCYVI